MKLLVTLSLFFTLQSFAVEDLSSNCAEKVQKHWNSMITTVEIDLQKAEEVCQKHTPIQIECAIDEATYVNDIIVEAFFVAGREPLSKIDYSLHHCI